MTDTSIKTFFLLLSNILEMADNLKRQAIVDFDEATAQKDPGVERGPGSNLMNLLLYSAAQVEALCRIAKEVLFVYISPSLL